MLSLLHVAGYYAGYVLLLLAATFVIPGKVYKGTPAADGKSYTFTLNGLSIFLILLAVLAGSVGVGALDGNLIYDNYYNFFIVANIFAFAFATHLFLKGWREGDYHPTHSFLAQYWEGVQLMPHVFGTNAKMFWLKPSMMAWTLINLSFLYKHAELNGGNMTLGIVLYNVFTLLYVVDYFFCRAKNGKHLGHYCRALWAHAGVGRLCLHPICLFSAVVCPRGPDHVRCLHDVCVCMLGLLVSVCLCVCVRVYVEVACV